MGCYYEASAGFDGGDVRRRARRRCSAWTRRIVAWWLDDGFDLLLTPTLAEPPPVLGDIGGRSDGGGNAAARSLPFAAFTAPFNVTGQPAMSVPLYWSRRRACRSACSSSPRRSARTCCSGSPRSSRRHGRGPTAGRRSTPEIACVADRHRRGRSGLLRRHARRGRRAARRRRRLPVPRGARGADARDPAEGPPARRDRGYTRDLPAYLARALPFVADGRTKVITNAGGINPAAATRAAVETARDNWASPASRSRPSSATTCSRGSPRCTRRRPVVRAPRHRHAVRRLSRRRRCSRPRTSARARSPTRSRRAPTS